MSLGQFEALLHAQGGVCAICKTASPTHKNKWHVDHDHQTGMVRGIVCGHCNAGLGYFRDSVESLRSAIEYLTGDLQQAREFFARESEWPLSLAETA